METEMSRVLAVSVSGADTVVRRFTAVIQTLNYWGVWTEGYMTPVLFLITTLTPKWS